MTAQPSSQAEREDVAREVLAEEAERVGLNGTAEWLRAGCPDRFPQWPGVDETARREVAGRVAAMLAFSDREHATPRSMPEGVVEAYERAAKVCDRIVEKIDALRHKGLHSEASRAQAKAIAAAIRAIPGASA